MVIFKLLYVVRDIVTIMASEIYIGAMRPITVEYYRIGELFYQGTIFRYPGMGTIQFCRAVCIRVSEDLVIYDPLTGWYFEEESFVDMDWFDGDRVLAEVLVSSGSMP